MRKSWYNIHFNKMKKVGILRGHPWVDRNFQDLKDNNAFRGGEGPIGYTLLFVGTGISMFGMVSGQILNNPRVIFRLSRDNVIPFSRLASIHHRFKTPYWAILLYSGLGFTLATVSGFRGLAVIASSSMLLVYFGVSLSVIGLRNKKDLDNGGFKIPFGYTVPILSAGIILFFLYNLTGFEIRGILILIGILTSIYFLGKVYRKGKKQKG